MSRRSVLILLGAALSILDWKTGHSSFFDCGATVKLATCDSRRGNLYGDIRDGVVWVEKYHATRA